MSKPHTVIVILEAKQDKAKELVEKLDSLLAKPYQVIFADEMFTNI